MNKLSIALLVLFAVALLLGGSYMSEAKWTNNGDGTYTLSYKYTDAEKQQMQEAFAAMYPNEYEAWKADNRSDNSFVNMKVKGYIQEVRQNYEAQKAFKAVVVPVVVDSSE
jgi:major membrane immunogen (membrane-anchored lipoprotein)